MRTRTEICRPTDAKNQVRALREQLEPDDQMLLILRVDRQMEWRDLALVMSTGQDVSHATLDEAALDRKAAHLRKRFEREGGDQGARQECRLASVRRADKPRTGAPDVIELDVNAS